MSISEKTYSIKLSGRQLRVLMIASEVLARLGIGQWREAAEKLPLQPDYEAWHSDLDRIGEILARHTGGIDGYRRSLSISGDRVSQESKIAWDLFQSIRHKLSWGEAVCRGDVESESSRRNWDSMLGVHYDTPMLISGVPAITMEVVGD